MKAAGWIRGSDIAGVSVMTKVGCAVTCEPGGEASARGSPDVTSHTRFDRVRHRTAEGASISCHSCSERTVGVRERSDSTASQAALAALSVVVYATRWVIAAWRSE